MVSATVETDPQSWSALSEESIRLSVSHSTQSLRDPAFLAAKEMAPDGPLADHAQQEMHSLLAPSALIFFTRFGYLTTSR
jgi:hypothetical protein